MRKAFVDAATTLLGVNAFKRLSIAEKGWQAGVSAAKHTIVIRSIIVPMSNLASNVTQLMLNGVGLRDITTGFATKLVEIEKHLKNLERKVEIEAALARHSGDPAMTRKLETELQTLLDSSKRMSIWPLIEAGEFSTISEGLTEADAAITQGKWVDYISDLTEKIPQRLGTVGRYAMVTRDTALFKGMARATQYGDFLAKAVLYEHMTKRDKKPHETAMQKITEEFVNYNLLPGRTRSYAESMGLTWFWAYKLRSMKVALNHVRENPFRSLLLTNMVPMLPDVPGVSMGSPITDNAATVIQDGRAGYSLGTGMLFSAPGLNPIYNFFS